MKLPDKIISYSESVLRLLPTILDELSTCDMTPQELYGLLKHKASLPDFIEALDCLYMLRKVELNQQSEVLHYVA